MALKTIVDIIMANLGLPALVGLATYYDADSDAAVFRSGERYFASSRTCAVDASEFAKLADSWLLILSDSGASAILRVNDSGYLYRAGQFQRADNGPHFVPAAEDRDETSRVVIDIPVETFIDIFGTNETQVVYVWKLGR